MTTFDYGSYLASREWALLKEQVLERSGGICERCYNAPYQETHHKTYARIGHENVSDLLAVCSPCHRYLSAKSNVDPTLRDLPGWPLPFHYEGRGYMGTDSGEQLACPVCRFEYVHISKVEHECTAATCKFDDYTHGWVRGDTIRIAMWCENGHSFALEFGFHKGYTFLRVAPDWSTRADPLPDDPNLQSQTPRERV